MQLYYEELNKRIIKDKIIDINRILKVRDELARKYKPEKLPSVREILLNIDNKELKDKILLKPVRTISGVAPISLFTYPLGCKHGTCIFCPGGPGSYFGDVPQSYTGNEPATRRAARNKYDPYLQIFNRLEQYYILNHSAEKVEIIIQGGTFLSYPDDYKREFSAYVYKALNDFSDLFFDNNHNNINGKFDYNEFKKFFELPHEIDDKEKLKKLQQKILLLKGGSDLETEKLRNETSRIRCCVFCVETKPDWCFHEHINEMLDLGVTRVELGVQTIYDEILKYTNRGHTNEDSVKAIQLLKDSFLKTSLHLMPGLPLSDREKDINIFREFFTNQDYMPDFMKIYPCMVLNGTPLYRLWQEEKFKPITTEEASDIIVEGKRYIRKFCRINRLNRDIPTNVTEAGVDRTNLRQYVERLANERNVKCNCIRCREPRNRNIDFDNVKLLRENYRASNGDEVFLSIEDTKNDILIGFLRLRLPYKPFRKEITERSIGIREIHVYSQALQIGEKAKEDFQLQHRGFGTMLMNEAERIAKEEYDMKKILVTSGIGVRKYYENKFNYKKDGVYMSKEL